VQVPERLQRVLLELDAAVWLAAQQLVRLDAVLY
jgi:hypothetical protein